MAPHQPKRVRVQDQASDRRLLRGCRVQQGPDDKGSVSVPAKAGAAYGHIRPGQIICHLLSEYFPLSGAVSGNHGFRQGGLQDDPILFPGKYFDHAGPAAQAGPGAQDRRAAHAGRSRDDQDLAEGPFVAAGIPGREHVPQLIGGKGEHARLRCQGSVRDSDFLTDRLSAVKGAGVIIMSSLIISERNGLITAHRASHHLSILRGNTGRNIHSVDPGPAASVSPFPVFVDLMNQVRRRACYLPAETGPENTVDQDRRGKVIQHTAAGAVFFHRQAVSVQDPHLCLQGGTFRNLSRETEKTYLIARVRQQSSGCQSVRPVIASAADSQYRHGDRAVPADFFHKSQSRPFHQYQSRDSDGLPGIAVTFCHFFSRQ